MREIVVGAIQTNAGVQTIPVWFRFPITGATRQAYYGKIQGSFTPLAPGDYTSPGGADFAEVALLQSGQWIERSNFSDVIDPTASLATIQTRLANIYNAAAAAQLAADNAALARWASDWDGTSWHMKSA